MRVEGLSDAELARRPHRIRGTVAAALLDRGAISPDHATGYAPQDARSRRELRALFAADVVRATPDGRCWLDLRRHYAIAARRERMRALIAAPIAVLLAIVAMLFYRG